MGCERLVWAHASAKAISALSLAASHQAAAEGFLTGGARINSRLSCAVVYLPLSFCSWLTPPGLTAGRILALDSASPSSVPELQHRRLMQVRGGETTGGGDNLQYKTGVAKTLMCLVRGLK